jgi:hypothetical protein
MFFISLLSSGMGVVGEISSFPAEAALSRKLRGHDAYYGITGNARALSLLRPLVQRIWQKCSIDGRGKPR